MSLHSAIDEYHRIAYVMTKLQPEEAGARSKTDAMTTVIRETVGLIAEFAQSFFEAVDELKHQKSSERTVGLLVFLTERRLRQIVRKEMERFAGRLNVSTHSMQAEALLPLTEEKREELIQEYETTACKVIEEYKKIIATTPPAFLSSEPLDFGNLDVCDHASPNSHNPTVRGIESFLQHLQTSMDENNRIYVQLLEGTTFYTLREESLLTEQKAWMQQRQRIVTEDLNPGSAAQTGNVSYLQQAVSAFSFWSWRNKNFLNSYNSDQATLLHLACTSRQYHVVVWLLEQGADPTLRDREGYTAIHRAVKVGDLHIVMRLVERDSASLNALGAYGRTPLHIAVSNGHRDLVKYLLEQGAQINAQTHLDDHRKTPLHEAIICQKMGIVSLLLQQPFLNPQLKDAFGHSPFYTAMTLGLLDIAALITQHANWHLPTHPKDLDWPLILTPLRSTSRIKVTNL